MSRFDAYSRYYDLLYRDKPYVLEAEYASQRLREGRTNANRALELGCGTGRHAEELAKLGWTVHGIDLSQTMLDRAVERRSHLAHDLAGRINTCYGDVRTYRTDRTFDSVVSLFHVASYQTSDADLSGYVATAAAHLENSGVFLFDFWYGPAVLTLRPAVNVKRLENDSIRVTRVAEPDLRVNDNIVDVHYRVSVEDKVSGRSEQIHETHSMRYLFLPEIGQLLRAHGFTSWDAEEWMTGKPPGADTWGVCVRARR